MDTLAEYTLSSESVSSLLVFEKKDGRGTRARRPVGEGFGTKHLTATTDEVKAHNGQSLRNSLLFMQPVLPVSYVIL